nr:MAG TPA_asm: hypothetical protein [Bacteriophage sp.]
MICRIRQKMPANGRPIVKNCNQGNNNARISLIKPPLLFEISVYQ